METLASRHCTEAAAKALSPTELQGHLQELPGWRVEAGTLTRDWKFADHYRAMAFVNAIAWISHSEDHHPDLRVGYNTVQVSYSTHSAGEITEKDLICAAKVAALG